ncbi:MAG TPA: hypothetical protein VFE57_09300, partial [Cyclobacteriaceae bacterium]|nr:hypothetical protein [Cyclobacteriaceae bacterium]
ECLGALKSCYRCAEPRNKPYMNHFAVWEPMNGIQFLNSRTAMNAGFPVLVGNRQITWPLDNRVKVRTYICSFSLTT